jgi:transcription termination/antitermination protein NusG
MSRLWAEHISGGVMLTRGVEAVSRWYAVMTRARHEQVVQAQLLGRAVEVYLPTIVRWSQWKDRRKKITWPMFPGYCFARFDANHIQPVVSCAGVVRIVSFEGKPVPVSDSELNSLRILSDSHTGGDPCGLIETGAYVDIIRGPLQGVTGRLVSRDARRARVALAVEIIGRAVRVDVDADDIALSTGRC